ncbi:MAG: thymidylate kinase [Planctomycetota bacterium]
MNSYTAASIIGSAGEPEETGFAASPPDLLTEITGAEPVDISSYPGRLICLEGTDGVGRTTHTALLREWLETHGYGVVHSAIKTSALAGEGLARAQEGHTLGRRTMDLFYATDFADRLERSILPALKAGFVVLTDRYIYASIARSIVRGSDPAWIEDVYRFAPEPHAVFYLDVDVDHLTPRVVSSGGFDYWESGMDFQEGEDVHASFVRYQGRLLAAFGGLAERHGFTTVDARRPVEEVFADIRGRVEEVVGEMEGARA